MQLTPLALFFIAQAAEPLLPVTIQCVLDTELPVEEIRVSVEEKRERMIAPGVDGKLTLRDLPEGNLHLLFYRNETLLGRVALSGVRLGQFIRIRVRLVEGNAILTEEMRVKGVSEEASSGRVASLPDKPSTEPPSPPVSPGPSSAPATNRSAAEPSLACPPQDEPVDLEGRLIRKKDRESFVLEVKGSRRFTIYAGSRTRIFRGSSPANLEEIREGEILRVRGSGASGPKGECSVGAREIRVPE